MGLYAASGAIRVTVVSGSTWTGLYAADGSLNVIVAPGTSFVGAYHPCGALYVTVGTSTTMGHHAPDGSMYVVESSTNNGPVFVSVVSGSLATGSRILLEDGTSKLLMEDGSGLLLE